VRAFVMDVPLRLRSKSNARRFRAGSRPDPGLSSFEAALAAQVRSVRPSGWDLGERSGPLGERPALAAVILARSPLDAGNFPKSVLDALEGVLYHNDASVLALTCISQRSGVREGSFRLGFALLRPSPSPRDLAAASAALASEAVSGWGEISSGEVDDGFC